MLLHQHYVPHVPNVRCGWDGRRSGEGIGTFFRKLFPFFFKRAARIVSKPLIKTVARSVKTIGKKAVKSASKHGLKKIAKEIAKEGASEIARAATEKLLEGVDNISNKAKQKGASAQKTDTAAAAVKRSIKPLADTINKNATKKIENDIGKLLPPSVSVKKRKIANKSASKHDCLKKIAKEIAKEDASEIARAATEKTDIAVAVKRSIKTLDDTINKEIARRAASQKLLEGTSDDAVLFEPVKQPVSSTERAPRKKKRLLLTREKLLTQRSTCSLCYSIFSTPWHMRRHIINVHVGIKEKYTVAECSYCSKLFHNSGNRSKHIKRFHS